MRSLTDAEIRHVAGGKITAVTTTTQFNGGGNTPKGSANGVPVVSTTTNYNPAGSTPPGQN